MNDNRLKKFLSNFQSEIAVICSLAMIYGFLAGRAILSLGMFLFFLNAIWNCSWNRVKQQKFWLLGLLWIGIYALTYFWSDDIPYWQERFQVKYAFVIIPLAFGLLPPFKSKHIKIFTIGMLIMAVSGCVYSLSFYFKDQEKILQGYFLSRVFTTPAYKDHIRFSIFIAWVVLWLIFIFHKNIYGISRYILGAVILFLITYLHILSARSGLLLLYSFGLSFLGYLMLKGKWRYMIGLALSLVLISVIAYHKIPSFRLKMQFAQYTYNEFKKGNKSVDYSDIGRIVSYELAGKAIAEHPIIGVGAGDIRQAMKEKYIQYAPQAKPEQMIVPHNQFLEVMLAGGVLALIPFLAWVFYPLVWLQNKTNKFYVVAIWIGLVLCLMVEAMLEVQFGVFVYLFALLWMMKIAENEVVTAKLMQNHK